jgi:plastocyanin
VPLRILTLIGGLLALATACSPSSGSRRPPAQAGVQPSPTPAGQLLQIGELSFADFGTRSLRGKTDQGIDALDFGFKGTFLHGSPGQKITLKVKNVSKQPHNFSLPEQQIDLDLPVDGPRIDVEVVLPTEGALRFYCNLHAERGMNGQLVADLLAPAAGQ